MENNRPFKNFLMDKKISVKNHQDIISHIEHIEPSLLTKDASQTSKSSDLSKATVNSIISKIGRSKTKSSLELLVGSKISFFKEYGGLGKRYYDRLGNDLDRISQVDVVASITETKGSVRARGIKLAQEMKSLGIVENDIVVISSRSNADQTIVVLATLFLGAIVAPLDPLFSYRECMTLMRQLKPKMCFGDSRTISQIERIVATMGLNAQIVNFSSEGSGASQFSKMLNHKEDESFKPTFIEDPRKSVAFILPSQGTTGDPKLVCLSHQNILVQTMVFQDIFDFPDKVLSFFPLSWFLQTVLICLSFEANTTRILPGAFTERNACKILHDYEIGHAIFGTDLAMRLVTDVAIKDFDLKCLKCVMIGTVNTTKYDIKTLRSLMPHVKFLQNYCLTETGCIAATKIKTYDTSLSKPMSVGSLSLNCKIRIVDFVTKEYLGPDKYGEIYYSGDGQMLGYFKDPENTLSSFEKGFFRTGDLGKYDEDGWLYIKGRICDLLEIDSRPCSPIDVEDIILTHPSVKDVVVIGDERVLIAVVKKKQGKEVGAEALQKFVSDRSPSNIHLTRVVFLDHFPRTTIGNVRKNALREEYLHITIHYTSSLASITTSPSATI
ncbi:unnamed protein product [Phaedon cochleariae]|uniref:Uncharacterized protein n=1 Tax=Phaedon cochleariae TaxID=80249 RepID=A0A9P0GLJ8_PHACE|nr:unnamed protein product [Phaedon cochleariae]